MARRVPGAISVLVLVLVWVASVWSGSAPAQGAVPLASLTLNAATNRLDAAAGCRVFAMAAEQSTAAVRLSGALVVDALDVGVNGLPVDVHVDGVRVATATTKGNGSYAVTVPLSRADRHQVIAHLRLPTAGTSLEPAGETTANNVGITAQTLTLCIDRHPLRVTASGPGAVTIVSPTLFRVAALTCRGVCEDLVDAGRAVTLAAAPEGRAKFEGWSGACTGTALTCRVVDGGLVMASFHIPGDPTCTGSRCTDVRHPPGDPDVHPDQPPVMPTSIVHPPPPTDACRTVGFLCKVPTLANVLRTRHLPIVLLLALLFAIAFPAALFNSTLQNNYAEVVGWFERWSVFRSIRAAYRHLPRLVAIGAFVVVASIAATVAEHDRKGQPFAVFVGAVIAFVITMLAFEVPKVIQARLHSDAYAGTIRAFPGGLIVAVGCAAASSALGLSKPYVYGIVAAFVVVRGERREEWEERAAAFSAFTVIVVTLAAWVAWSLYHQTALAESNSPFDVALGVAFAGTFLAGFEGLIINFLPLKYLDGQALRRWNRQAWLAVEVGAVLLLTAVISTGDPGEIDWEPLSWHDQKLAITMFVAFALGSFAFWGYFAWRDRAAAVSTAEGPRFART